MPNAVKHPAGVEGYWFGDSTDQRWRTMNDAGIRRTFSHCAHCGGQMIVKTREWFTSGHYDKATGEYVPPELYSTQRYWVCEHSKPCKSARHDDARLSHWCECDAEIHDAYPLATLEPLPAAAPECAGEHTWQYERPFTGDYEGPAFMAPYGDRRWCTRCARPEVKAIATSAQTKHARALIYVMPLLARLITPWRLDTRMVQHCKECGHDWYQVNGTKYRITCPRCGCNKGSGGTCFILGVENIPDIPSIIGLPAQTR